MSKDNNKLTFGELIVGNKFIAFPVDGDNSGHGGYKTPYRIFKKIYPKRGKQENAVSLKSKVLSHIPDSMEILPIE